MRDALDRCQAAIAASRQQIARMLRGIDVSRVQIDQANARIQESEQLLARVDLKRTALPSSAER
jgi:hypothetical protein